MSVHRVDEYVVIPVSHSFWTSILGQSNDRQTPHIPNPQQKDTVGDDPKAVVGCLRESMSRVYGPRDLSRSSVTGISAPQVYDKR